MRNFEYYTPTQVLFGKDTHLQAGSLLKKYGAKKVLIHYGGQSAVRSGLIDEITSNLKEEGLEYITLGGVIPNPPSFQSPRGNRIMPKRTCRLYPCCRRRKCY